jgi:hypothetical protein
MQSSVSHVVKARLNESYYTKFLTSYVYVLDSGGKADFVVILSKCSEELKSNLLTDIKT